MCKEGRHPKWTPGGGGAGCAKGAPLAPGVEGGGGGRGALLTTAGLKSVLRGMNQT